MTESERRYNFDLHIYLQLTVLTCISVASDRCRIDNQTLYCIQIYWVWWHLWIYHWVCATKIIDECVARSMIILRHKRSDKATDIHQTNCIFGIYIVLSIYNCSYGKKKLNKFHVFASWLCATFSVSMFFPWMTSQTAGCQATFKLTEQDKGTG